MALHLAVRLRHEDFPEPRRAEVPAADRRKSTSSCGSGHFDIWTHTGNDHCPVMSLVLPCTQNQSPRSRHAWRETMLVSALHACERLLSRRFSSWSGPAKSAAEAMSAAMFDTEGEA